MIRRVRYIFICAGCLLQALAGLAQTRPAFEVASVRPAVELVNAVTVGVQVSGAQVRISGLSVRDYIGMAYNLRPQQIDGPDWLGSARFEIAAKIPDGGRPEQVPEMMQALLEERFQMKSHRESREFTVYALAVHRDGLKLQPIADATAAAPAANAPVQVGGSGSGGGVNMDLGGGASFSFAGERLEAKRITMGALADMLTRFLDRPVIDATNLAGRYDISAPIAREDYQALMIRAAVNGGITMPPQALRFLDAANSDPLAEPLRTVGLALDARRAPLDVLVVDSISRTPTAN
jgi:uncharacterized protein (TIGR03435 family)